MSKVIKVEISLPDDFKEEVIDLIVKAAVKVIDVINPKSVPEVTVTQNETEPETEEVEVQEPEVVEETPEQPEVPTTVKEQLARKKQI